MWWGDWDRCRRHPPQGTPSGRSVRRDFLSRQRLPSGQSARPGRQSPGVIRRPGRPLHGVWLVLALRLLLRRLSVSLSCQRTPCNPYSYFA